MLFIKLIIDSDHMSPKTSVNDWHRCVHTTVAAYNVFLAQNKHRIFIHSPLAYCPHELITTSEGHNARKISSQEYEQSLWNELMKFYIPVTSAFFEEKKYVYFFAISLLFSIWNVAFRILNSTDKEETQIFALIFFNEWMDCFITELLH